MAFYNSPADLLPKQAFRWRVRFGNDNFSNEACKMKPHLFAKSITKPSYEIKSTDHKYLGMHKFNFPTHLEWKPITITFYDVYAEGALKDIKDGKQGFKYNSSTTTTLDKKPLINGGQEKAVPFSTQMFFATFLNKSGYYQPEEYDREDDLLRFRRHLFKRNVVSSLVGDVKDYDIDNNGNEQFVNTEDWNALYIDELHPDGFVMETWIIKNPMVTSVKFGELSYEDDKILNVTVDLVYDWASINGASFGDLADIYIPKTEGASYNSDRKNVANTAIQSSKSIPYIDESRKIQNLNNSTPQEIRELYLKINQERSSSLQDIQEKGKIFSANNIRQDTGILQDTDEGTFITKELTSIYKKIEDERKSKISSIKSGFLENSVDSDTGELVEKKPNITQSNNNINIKRLSLVESIKRLKNKQ